MNIVIPGQAPHQDATLLASVMDFLVRHEAANSIQLAALWGRDDFPPDLTTLVALDDDNQVAGVATQSGTFLMLVSEGMTDRAADIVTTTLVENDNIDVPGVMGPPAVAQRIANRWAYLTGGVIKPGMPQRILQTSSVIAPTEVEGSWRLVEESDRDLLREWFAWFALDAEGARPEQARRAGEAILSRMAPPNGGLIWMDDSGRPVSVASFKGRTPNSMRIGPVFTPAKLRRHGYGAAVTAATTRYVLDQGLSFASLYTDAGNSTANHIYEAIGYRFVADSMQYRFIWSTHDDDYAD